MVMTTAERQSSDTKPLQAADAPSKLEPTGCCPPFDPASWQEREVTWKEKPFVTDRVRSFLHVPLDVGKKLSFNHKLIDAAGAASAQGITLTDENSLWGADIYIEVTGPVPGARMTTLSGTFVTKVYEGPFSMVGEWATDMARLVAETGRRVDKIYFGYTTCPRCAKAYGKNYVILFAKLADTAS
jgi:hypothetical protein